MTLTQLAPHPMASGLAVSVSSDAKGTVVALRGEADVATLPIVVDALTAAIADGDGAVIVDLSDTEFIDSATVRAVGRASQFLGARGRTLSIRSPSRIAARVLGLLCLSSLIDRDVMTSP